MIFIDNKYTKYYFQIVNRAKSRVMDADIQYENHHIIPDCFFIERSRKGTPGWLDGNSESNDNKVNLTAKEHFIAHLLLTKMISGRPKYQMLQAATAMVKWASKNHNRDIKINSNTYSRLKKQRSEALKELWKNNDYRKLALSGFSGQWEDQQHIEKMSELRKDLWKDDDYLKKMQDRPRSYKKVIIEGVIYDSLIEAGKSLGVTANCVTKRCKNTKMANWNYL